MVKIPLEEHFDNAWYDYSHNLDNEGKEQRYTVYAENGYQNFRRTTDDPKEALDLWFKYGRKFPSDIAILVSSDKDAKDLYAVCDEDFITKLYYQYSIPYKLDWLLDQIKKQKEFVSGYYDSDAWEQPVEPFSYG